MKDDESTKMQPKEEDSATIRPTVPDPGAAKVFTQLRDLRIKEALGKDRITPAGEAIVTDSTPPKS